MSATCPHCQGPLSTWRVPPGTSWSEEVFLVCFNDGCPFYVAGWSWMMEQYGQVASYRFLRNPSTGASSSLPVWSPQATREQILPPEP